MQTPPLPLLLFLFLLCLHYPRKISVSLVALLNPFFFSAIWLQLIIPIFLTSFSTSNSYTHKKKKPKDKLYKRGQTWSTIRCVCSKCNTPPWKAAYTIGVTHLSKVKVQAAAQEQFHTLTSRPHGEWSASHSSRFTTAAGKGHGLLG